MDDFYHAIGEKFITMGSASSLLGGPAKHWVMQVAGAALLVIATAIHVYEYFGASPVSLAALFVVSAAGTAVGAGLLLANVPRLGWLIGGGASLLTFAGYCVTRTVGIPVIDPSDDIGNWLEPLGVISLVVEAGAVLLAVIALAVLTPHRVQNSPTPRPTTPPAPTRRDTDSPMPWTYLRAASSLLGAASITPARAVPASAKTSTRSTQDPEVGASSTLTCRISYPTKDFGSWASFPASNRPGRWSLVRLLRASGVGLRRVRRRRGRS